MMFPNSQDLRPSEAEIASILAHRYGDGTVYLPRGGPKQLFHASIKLGFISEDGFVTHQGRELLARYATCSFLSRDQNTATFTACRLHPCSHYLFNQECRYARDAFRPS